MLKKDAIPTVYIEESPPMKLSNRQNRVKVKERKEYVANLIQEERITEPEESDIVHCPSPSGSTVDIPLLYAQMYVALSHLIYLS